MTDQKYAYRFMEMQFAPPLDEWDNPVGQGRVELHLERYPIIKFTPKGVWINNCGRKRWINLHAHKRFACLTIEDALESYKQRKLAQKRILLAQFHKCNKALGLAYERKYKTYTYDLYEVADA